MSVSRKSVLSKDASAPSSIASERSRKRFRKTNAMLQGKAEATELGIRRRRRLRWWGRRHWQEEEATLPGAG
jgi:hypothetical protein